MTQVFLIQERTLQRVELWTHVERHGLDMGSGCTEILPQTKLPMNIQISVTASNDI